MIGVKRRAVAVLLAIGLATAMLACDGRTQGPVSTRGIIEDVDRTGRKLTLDHGELPGLMKAMTMTFDVASEVSLDGLAAGDEITFWVEAGDGSYTVTQIQRSPE